jgi:hypothetical protein
MAGDMASKKTTYSDPMQEINRFANFLDETFGRKTWSPHAKRWWNDDLDKQRKQLLNLPPHSPEFKAIGLKWFKVVRKAKRKCWESFLQASDPDRIWTTINSKPARHAIPALRIRSEDGTDQVVATHNEKVAAISAISFPEREDVPLPPPPTNTAHAPKFRGICIQGLNDILSETSNQSSPGPDGICYLAIRL